MDVITGISQLFMNLCHNSVWSYAILWKLQETTQMLLTCEDAYVNATKANATTDFTSCTGFLSSDPVFFPFASETNAQNGDIFGCSIEVVISYISKCCYFFGQGIVGMTAMAERHKWISLWDLDSSLLFEYPEELQLQFAAGIKTILLVPVLPLGLVQVGSFFEISEDMEMVAQIKDLFLTYQYTSELQHTLDLETDNVSALDSPTIHNYSSYFPASNPSNFQSAAMQNWLHLDHDEVIDDEFFPACSDTLPPFMVQSYLPLLQDEPNAESSMEQDANNSSTDTGSTLIDGQSILASVFEDLHQNGYGFKYIDEACIEFGDELDEVINSVTDDGLPNYIGDIDMQELIQSCSLSDFQESSWWNSNTSESNELSKFLSVLDVELPEPVRQTIGDSFNDYFKEAEIHEQSDEKVLEPSEFCCSDLSEKCSDSPTTPSKDGSFMGSADFLPGIHRKPSPISNTEGFGNGSVVNNILSASNEEEELQWGRFNLRRNIGKGKRRGSGRRQRPRDRQLIHDRITELKELIPNGSKCSMEELLGRAITYMMFLASVPAHAEKLKKSNRTKVLYCWADFEQICHMSREPKADLSAQDLVHLAPRPMCSSGCFKDILCLCSAFGRTQAPTFTN